ncbi:3947_t:CDS:2 [Ambispora leptoticha]|uniref:3947_t:CDS:1 n=1 Tax=Ambispora leptoticha TaxID=144679 RepID=A0A9N8YLX8_9GLOM|nr:3947_t:CDS:2 [Ambispora leptoticha]
MNEWWFKDFHYPKEERKKINTLNISNRGLTGELCLVMKKCTEKMQLKMYRQDLSEGLEHLPESCQKLYCNSDYKYESIKIMEKLDKSSCSEKRLYVIREINNINQLQSPKELYKLQLAIYAAQSIGRSAAVLGAVFIFRDSQAIGGGIAAIYPITELFEIEKLKGGEIKKSLEDLNNNLINFLSDYDKDNNEEVDINELISKRVIIKYRKLSYGMDEKDAGNQLRESMNRLQIENDQETKIEIPPK